MTRLPDDDRKGGGPPAVLRYDGRRLVPVFHKPIPELSVSLSVNGTSFATLLASPHDLHYLVAGFLRLQGVIRTPADLLTLTVFEQQGAVSVRIRGDAPRCPVFGPSRDPGEEAGSPGADAAGRPVLLPGSGPFFRPEAVFRIMGLLSRMEDGCREHGGMHRAGAGDGERLLLSAEDIGRHNAVDRVAGEALLKGIDLSGRILAVTGRVSSGVASKAAFLGVSTIVSPTCPTESAIRSCRDRGITLIGCVRGGRFNVYSHPGRIATSLAAGRIGGVTGAILSGGTSRRMGCDKALLPYRGGRFIEAIYRKMAELFEDVIVVGPEAGQYDFLPCRVVPDRFPGMGALSGIHSALFHCATDRVFVVGCDMPHIKGDLVRYLCSFPDEADAVIPEGACGPEPLYALYRKTALPAVEEALRDGRRGLLSFHEGLRVQRVGRDTVDRIDPGLTAFRNINTPEDYFRFRREGDFPPA